MLEASWSSLRFTRAHWARSLSAWAVRSPPSGFVAVELLAQDTAILVSKGRAKRVFSSLAGLERDVESLAKQAFIIGTLWHGPILGQRRKTTRRHPRDLSVGQPRHSQALGYARGISGVLVGFLGHVPANRKIRSGGKTFGGEQSCIGHVAKPCMATSQQCCVQKIGRASCRERV